MSTKLAQAHGLYLEYSPAVKIIIIKKKDQSSTTLQFVLKDEDCSC